MVEVLEEESSTPPLPDEDRARAIAALIHNAELAGHSASARENIANAISKGLAFATIPNVILGEDAAATGLTNEETRKVTKSVAVPIVGVSEGMCGELHACIGADPRYVAKRDDELECLPKTPSINPSNF